MASSTGQWRSAKSSGRPEVIQPSTRFWAETTVLWLRWPKKWPISLKRGPRVFAGKPHGQHPRMAHPLSLDVGLQTRRFEPEDLADGLFDVGQPHGPAALPDQIGQRLLGHRQRNRTPERLAGGQQPAQAPESSRAWLVNREATNCCTSAGTWSFIRLAICPRMPKPGGVVGRLDAADQPAGEPRDQLRPQLRQFGRRTVGGEDKLPAFAQERVDRVQQLDLRGPLAHEELQIVEHEHSNAAIFPPEAGQTAAAQRFEKLAGELLGREVDGRQTPVRLPCRRPNAFQQVGLADAGRAAEHQRRQLAGLADDHFGRGDGQPIGVAGDKRLEAWRTGGARARRAARRRRPIGALRGGDATRRPGCTLFVAPLFSAGRMVAVAFARCRINVKLQGRTLAEHLAASVFDVPAEVRANPVQKNWFGAPIRSTQPS